MVTEYVKCLGLPLSLNKSEQTENEVKNNSPVDLFNYKKMEP